MRSFAISRRLAVAAAGLVAVGLTPGTAVGAVETATAPAVPQAAKPQIEQLNRGVISVHTVDGNRVSWRLLAGDPAGVTFNVYRDGTRVTRTPAGGPTSFVDSGAPVGARYTVRAVVDGVEQPSTFAAEDSLTLSGVPGDVGITASTRDVPIQIPPGGRTPSGENYTYVANDASVGDLDGDGQYEIVLKWDPTNAKDNAQAGYTGNVYLDAYRLDGTRLWRIDLGRNIRAGAHYTQFQVFDYDGDGRAEVAVKTADGTRSGTGQVIGNANADHRNSSGYVLAGPEFLTVFRGTDGAVLDTENYVPPRGNVSSWGDNYGNRVDRFLAGTAYVDGSRPSIIMARGYYTRSVISAWDFRDGQLTRRWTFDSNNAGSQWAARVTTSCRWRMWTPTAATRSCTAPWPSTTTVRDCGRTTPTTATPTTSATSSHPPRPRGVQTVGVDQRTHTLDGRRAHRADHLERALLRLRQRPRGRRRHLVR